jgi:outer membrane protein OmpA-like peptidoglycan-associated protein
VESTPPPDDLKGGAFDPLPFPAAAAWPAAGTGGRFMRRPLPFVAILLCFFVIGGLSPAQAQFGKLKDKVKKKVEQKAEEKTDKALEGGEPSEETEPPEETPEAAPGEGEGEEQAPPAAGSTGTATAEDMTLYRKYDFVPGDRVIFFDDLSTEELGEFPSRWDLERGVFEVVKQHDQHWILCTDEGGIYPKVPIGPLPEKYTIEMEFYANPGPADGWFQIYWYDASNDELARLWIAYDENTSLRINGKDLASKTLPRLAAGKHVMRVMATRTTLKCYIDQERIANVPATEGFAPVRIGVRIDPYYEDHGPTLIGAFRYAEGGKSLKQQLDEAGKIVTHGILFDSGSARIKAESYKTLADIGALLTENPALRLSIEGHTDGDGSEESNVQLSQERAASVKAYLVDIYKIDAGRLESAGLGESKPIETNETAEGKAMNRRVELVKL